MAVSMVFRSGRPDALSFTQNTPAPEQATLAVLRDDGWATYWRGYVMPMTMTEFPVRDLRPGCYRAEFMGESADSRAPSALT
jgi:hypothetical protein